MQIMLNPKFEYRSTKQTSVKPSVKPMSGSRRRFGNPNYQNSNDQNNESAAVGGNSHFFLKIEILNI